MISESLQRSVFPKIKQPKQREERALIVEVCHKAASGKDGLIDQLLSAGYSSSFPLVYFFLGWCFEEGQDLITLEVLLEELEDCYRL